MDLGTIGKKFKRIGKDTMTEIQKMNDIRQINSKINEQKKQISAIYTQIGQKLYKLYKEAPLEGFDTEFQKIDERFAAIEVYNDQIREIKGVRMCPNCHTEVSLHERYCSACGQKLQEVVHIRTDEHGNTVIEGPEAEVIDMPEEAAKTVETEITDPEKEAEAGPEGLEAVEERTETEESEAAEEAEPEGSEETETMEERTEAEGSEAEEEEAGPEGSEKTETVEENLVTGESKAAETDEAEEGNLENAEQDTESKQGQQP